MVWPFNRNKKDEVVKKTEEEPKFLEDLPPKFEDRSNGKPEAPKPSVSQTLKNIKLEDFAIEKLIAIPCFREAGISGFTVMAAFGSVMFFYHKNINKAVNWAYGGFFIGSIFGWEQCNSVRRNSQMTAAVAKQAYEERQKLKLKEKYQEFLESRKK